jgi:HK97 family phage major capsid protein
MRLGAPIVYDEDDLPIPAMEDQPPESSRPDYLQRPETTKPKTETDKPRLKFSKEKPAARVSERHLHPKHHELAAKVIIPNDLACTLVEYPDVGQALKHDLARALALRADQAFLHGDGDSAPLGISNTGLVGLPIPMPANGGLLALVRDIVSTVRLRARFGCAGWILHPAVFDALSKLLTADGLNTAAVGAGGAWTLDAVTLLTQDGRDGGTLVGYPFIVTPAAEDGGVPTLHFSADWSEAWIAAHRQLVVVDVSVDVKFQTDETVIRAVMHHDFVVRRPAYFAYAERPAEAAAEAED